MKKLSLLLLFALASSDLLAQGALRGQVEALADLLGKVQVRKDQYDQMLLYQPDAPYRITLQVTEIDNRGRETRMKYRVNLGLLSVGEIDLDEGRDRLEITIGGGREPMVQMLEEEELAGYEKELVFLATDIDNARAIRDLLREIVPLARERWETDAALPTTYEDLLHWVSERVVDVEFEDERYGQTWTQLDHPSRIQFAQEADGDRYLYVFNLADLSPSDIEMDVRRTEATVELRTNDRRNYIQVTENGERDNFDDDFDIQCPNAEAAQVLAYGLRKLPGLARELPANQAKKYSTQAQALRALQAAITDFNHGGYYVRQSLTGGCQAVYQRNIDDDGDAEAAEFQVDFADFDPGDVEIEVARAQVAIQVKTRDGRDFIYVQEDGEQQNYEDDLSFPVADIPAAKQALQALQAVIRLCPRDVEGLNWTEVQARIASASTQLDDITQQVELMAGDRCKWAATILEEGRRSEETRYEFNLYDLDPSRVEIDVKGTQIWLELATTGGDDIIKTITDGEEAGFTDDLALGASSIPEAKALQATLQAMIRGCKE